jgi:hypothetical protein
LERIHLKAKFYGDGKNATMLTLRDKKLHEVSLGLEGDPVRLSNLVRLMPLIGYSDEEPYEIPADLMSKEKEATELT